MTLDGIPRRPVESDPLAALMAKLSRLEDQVKALERGATLRNASISGGDGLRVLGEDGETRVSINTTDGAVVAYDAAGTAVARFGPLANSNPGEYGVEVRYNGSWVQVGGGNVDWGNISNKPSTFTPSSHTHTGAQITSAVANATNAANAANATNAADADGSAQAFNGNVSGTSFYAVWVGNSTGYKFGRNTSSAKYKRNIRRHDAPAADVLALQPVIYDRNDELVYPEDPETGERLEGPPNLIPGTKGEYGLIAEQVAEHVPEIIQWYEGEIDGIRYDLLAVALLDVVKEQNDRIAALESNFNARLPKYAAPTRTGLDVRRKAAAAPDVPPAPATYEILPPEGVTE
ncbi:minor tail protein [Arthrobacter phage Crewmate]|uniref:Minor tail protein n=1 Tax=Arthrobacter phage Crewmate TaxID=2832317 RepID=A0AA48Y3K9_9CAUD|nr:tail fiber protein [Arthrobacter phage Crewmate]UIW13272.1 minor tail protein [Arthrobacter phage Crewmate]WGH21195.1 minor tail protein [Arthrobacter phage ObiToo]